MRHGRVLGGPLAVVAVSSLVASWFCWTPRAEPPAARTAGDATTAMTVAYRGLRITVPPGWRLYRLDRERDRCVRYDHRAIYLGAQGPSPGCPARLVGGEDVLHVEPAPAGAGPAPPAPPARGKGGTAGLRTDALARYTVRPAADHQVRVPLPEAGVAINGSYGADPSALQRLIRSTEITRERPAGPARGGPRSEPPPDAEPPRGPEPGPGDQPWDGERDPDEPPDGDPDDAPPPGDETGGPPSPRDEGPPRDDVPPRGAVERNWVVGKGFDTCSAPSLAAMRAWRRSFNVSNIYIGGALRGCSQPNLTRRWVRNVRAMGYRLTPTYVGLQAPCGRYRTTFRAANAAVEGRRAARDAVRKAKALGIPARKPIYYDMEAYARGKASCRKAVLTFLHNWTVTLNAYRYVSGVYSSVGSAVRDLARAKGITRPGAIWFALWDRRPTLYGHPYIPGRLWHPHRRIKQYRGPHKETHGGVTLNIDSNKVDGRVY